MPKLIRARLNGGIGNHIVDLSNNRDRESLCRKKPGKGNRSRWNHSHPEDNAVSCEVCLAKLKEMNINLEDIS